VKVLGYFLNKEIGGKNLWINNWTIPYKTNLHILKSVENKVMRFDYSSLIGASDTFTLNWETPNIPIDTNRTYGLYSKDRQATTINGAKVRLVFLESAIIRDSNNLLLNNIAPADYFFDIKLVDHCCYAVDSFAIVRRPSEPLIEKDCNFPLVAYPNPVNNELPLRIPYYEGNEVLGIELFDTYGKCINVKVKTDSKSYLVEKTNKLKGVYILHIYTANCTFTQNLIIR
jgi:hypothetical protein